MGSKQDPGVYKGEKPIGRQGMAKLLLLMRVKGILYGLCKVWNVSSTPKFLKADHMRKPGKLLPYEKISELTIDWKIEIHVCTRFTHEYVHILNKF